MGSALPAPGFTVEPLADGRLSLQIRSAAGASAPVRRLAWFVVVVGMTGLAGLVVLRVPLVVHAVYAAFFVGAALIVWSDTRAAGIRLDGELLVDVGRRFLERRRGISAVTWQTLTLPAEAVLVVDRAPGVDARRLIGGLGRPYRVAALPIRPGGAAAAWERVLADPALPADAVLIAEGASYEFARGVAEQLARPFGWSVFDLGSEEPEHRQPTELDLPLPDRIAAVYSERTLEAPRRRPWGVIAWRDGAGLHLAMRTAGLFGLVAETLVAIPLLALLFLLSGGNWGIPLFGLALLVFAFGGRSFVELTPQRAVLRTVNAWLPLGQELVVRWEEVEQVQVVTERGLCGLRFVSDRRTCFVPAPSRSAARWAALQIRSYLAEIGDARRAPPPESRPVSA